MKKRLTTRSKAGICAAIGTTLAGGAMFSSTSSAQDVLPAPPAPFKGQIGLSVKDSKSDFPQPIKAPKGAPNVVIILLDDVGFGASSTFGGPCDTPTLDKLAKNGLRYTQFHTTAHLIAHARVAAHRPQPPHGAHRQHHGTRHRLSGL